MASWRVAPSLDALLDEVDRLAPKRSKVSDGSIGDPRHQARPTSDHNPDGRGVVHARDITHDPRSGLDCYKLVAAIQAHRDRRVRYVIFAAKIYYGPWSDAVRAGKKRPWIWEPYTGVNAHKAHAHISVGYSRAAENDTSSWLKRKAAQGRITMSDVQKILDAIDDLRGDRNVDLTQVIGKVEAGYNLTAQKAGMVYHGVVQALVAESRANATALGRGLDDARSAVLGALAALPPPSADVDELALAAELKRLLDGEGVEVDPALIQAALRVDPFTA